MSNSEKATWDTTDLPQGEAKAKVVQNMFDAIAPRYDLVNRIMTFRLDTRWRKIAVRKLALSRGARVLDLASGTGDLCIDLRKAGLLPLSFDMSFGMLAADHSKAPRVQADILRLPIASASVDGVTCGFALRNLVDLGVFFHEISRVVKPGGRIALLDVSTPTNPIIRWGNSIYFGKVVPRIGGLLSNRAAYNYLPKSVAYLPEPASLVRMLEEAGFEHVRHEQLSGGLTQLMHATKKIGLLVKAQSFQLSQITNQTVDLNDFARGDGLLFVRDGVGFAARGVSARGDAKLIREILANIDYETLDCPIGVGPIMFGAIPFDSSHESDFVIPSVTICKTQSGETWMTLIDDAQVPDLSLNPPKPSHASFNVHEGVSVDTYLNAVDAARKAVQQGDITKAVIARDVIVESNKPIDVHAVLLRLRASFGSSYRFSFDGFIGASPELLVSIYGDEISSHPLAGTTPRTGDPETDASLAKKLLASAKNQVEHRVVIDMVHDTLLPHCSYLDWEAQPSIVQVANVQHLGTRLIGKLSQPHIHVLDASMALSPTPALGGFPRDKALTLIANNEGMSRDKYGGAIGWCDQQGNGVFAVAIRCAQLNDTRTIARLFAGGGIVADSEPLDELAETQAKLQAMLAAIVRP